MTWTAEQIQNGLEKILPLVQKPGRYTGGELNQVVKDWEAVRTHVAFVFPDVYDLGMSNLGLAVLYDQVNQRGDAWAERAFAPWTDMEAEMRRAGLPLYSLESKHALRDFDIVGFSLPYETLYTNALNALDLGGIPLFAAERSENDPLVIAGGHAVYNPEPVHAFFDAFVLGEGEEVIHEIVEAYQAWQSSGAPRRALLEALAGIWGVYVPAFYEPRYHEDGTIAGIERTWQGAPLTVQKRIVAKLPPPPTSLIVPYVDTTHNRVPIEIMRGCTRGCRFCHAGMVNRPVRERPVDEVLAAIEAAIRNTGIEEIGLLSLSSSDYTHVLELVQKATARFADQHIDISLPSLRIESFSVDLMDALKTSRRSGFTLAPEAASERMRNTINKPVSTEQLLETARAIYSRGWHTIKLYFMIGHPSETLEDVQAIADLAKAVREEGRKIIGGRAQVHAGVSTFIPKPHTPFQWVSCDTLEQIYAKQELLRHEVRGKGLKLNWNNPQETMLEAFLSRGDRRMAEVVHRAWQDGARFDAWHEHFRYDLWMQSFEKTGLDPAFYTHRERNIDEIFPWEHLSTTVRKRFLAQDYMWSHQQKTRVDCRRQCFACGILPTFSDLRIANPGDVWQCPEVKPKGAHGKKAIPLQVR
ncbi:MAG: hypothetical protein Fur0018_27110 [Anaerolineales bacterium]